MSGSDDYLQDCWGIFKHQICLSVGLLKSHYNPGQNLLLSPFALVSSLIFLAHNASDGTKKELIQILLDRTERHDRNEKIRCFSHSSKKRMHRSRNSVKFVNMLYTNSSKPIDIIKLSKKYRIKVKSVNFINPSTKKPDLSVLQTISNDLSQGQSTFYPILSNLEYVNLIDLTVRTVVASSLRFSGLWSKPFQIQHGLFRTSSGVQFKTEFLYNRKSYKYFHCPSLRAKLIKIKFSFEDKLSMVLILPDPEISMSDFITRKLNYNLLKQSLKRSSRFNVELTFPKFKITSTHRIPKPIQTLKLKQICELIDKPNKQPMREAPLDANLVLLQRLSLEFSEKAEPGYTNSQEHYGLGNAGFKADRPFLFALVTSHKAVKLILMIGVCEDPSA